VALDAVRAVRARSFCACADFIRLSMLRRTYPAKGAPSGWGAIFLGISALNWKGAAKEGCFKKRGRPRRDKILTVSGHGERPRPEDEGSLAPHTPLNVYQEDTMGFKKVKIVELSKDCLRHASHASVSRRARGDGGRAAQGQHGDEQNG
jgi:hypothetical protein